MEMLVAIGIVAVLAAVLTVVSGKATMSSKLAKSTANLRQIGAAISIYAAEENGRLPESAQNCTAGGQAVIFWFNALAYYIEGAEYFPNGPLKRERPAWQECPARPFKSFEVLFERGMSVGYGWNGGYFGTDKSPGNAIYGYGSRLSQVAQPSRTIIVGTNREKDSNGNDIGAGDAKNLYIYKDNPNSTRFDGAGLYLFVDGHTERLTPEQAKADDGFLFKKVKP